MHCPNCQRDNPEDAQFCSGCGNRLVSPTFEPAAEIESAANSDIDSSPSFSLSTSGFVGRSREMEELTSCVAATQAGQGQLAMLIGEPGIGKTRTAQELTALAEAQGFQTLWGRCYEGEGAPPYWPWVQPLRSYIQQTDPERLYAQMGPGRRISPKSCPRCEISCPD